MKESSTYQAILEDGRIEGQAQGAIAEARKLLRLRGEEAFGLLIVGFTPSSNNSTI